MWADEAWKASKPGALAPSRPSNTCGSNQGQQAARQRCAVHVHARRSAAEEALLPLCSPSR